jgi:hypothetical protein
MSSPGACAEAKQESTLRSGSQKPAFRHKLPPLLTVPKLLKMLSLKGTIVSVDALNCQRAIAQQIIDQQGDYA